MRYPKYIKTRDGYIGTFARLDFGEFPVYRFDGDKIIVDSSRVAEKVSAYSDD